MGYNPPYINSVDNHVDFNHVANHQTYVLLYHLKIQFNDQVFFLHFCRDVAGNRTGLQRLWKYFGKSLRFMVKNDDLTSFLTMKHIINKKILIYFSENFYFASYNRVLITIANIKSTR